jgi:hypothetical protein
MTRPRYRLRFLLQEIDLRPGETLIGRSALCHVTIEDPMVSRQHSRIMVREGGAVLEDLGSRNGTFVNGHAINGSHQLSDGDRVRVGTLELVFCRAPEAAPERAEGKRTTGFMCHCADCSNAYPAEVTACPHCGSSRRVDDDTISGVIGESQRNWTLELLVEVLGRAVILARWDDVERMLGRARINVEGRLASQAPLDRSHLDALADAAIRLARTKGEAQWAGWALNIHAALGLVPKQDALEQLDLAAPEVRTELAAPAARLVRIIEAQGGPPPDERTGFVRVKALVQGG